MNTVPALLPPRVPPLWGVRNLVLTVGTLTVMVPAGVQAQGCAMCKTALSGVNDPLAQGIFWSVLLLLSMPFLVVGSIGGWILYTYRNAYRNRRPSASVVPFDAAYIKKKNKEEGGPLP